MIDKPKYEVLRQFSNDEEILQALETGSLKDKRHALLSVAYGYGDGSAAFDLFLFYIDNTELRDTAYMSIHMFLETSRYYPLMRILPALIKGLDDDEPFIRSHCEDALENLISPGKRTSEELNFQSFQIQFNKENLSDYLNSNEPDKIIIGLLYTFFHPHDNNTLFQLLNRQLTKKIKAVSCVIGQIIDTKIYPMIEQINELEEISLLSYKTAIEIGLVGKSTWVHDRFDEIQDLANEQMKKLKDDTYNQDHQS